MSSRIKSAPATICLVVALGCGGAGPDVEVEIDYLEIYLVTSEAEGPLSLMLAGETGTAEAFAYLSGVGADPGMVTYTTSDESVIRIQRTGDRTADVVAVREGHAQIGVSSGGVQGSREVHVSNDPLPVDRMTISLRTFGTAATVVFEPGVTPSFLRGVRLPQGDSVEMFVNVYRDGGQVTRTPFTVTSSQPSAVTIELRCRSADLQVDPKCNDFSPWGLIRRTGTGESTILVRVQQQSWSFYVTEPVDGP